MYAIVETGSKQYKVSSGDVIKVEKCGKKTGSELVLRQVLMVYDKTLHLGDPYLKKAGVVCDVVKTDRDPKITIFKYKRRKGSRLKKGHRQPFTVLKVKKISLDAPAAKTVKKIAAAKPAAKKVAKPKKAVHKKKTAAKAKKK